MASIQGSDGGGRKSVDQELPLVPFIDLLFCCVMFLLASAVWNELRSVSARAPVVGPGGEDEVRVDQIELYLMVRADGFTLASSVGERVEITGEQGLSFLSEQLQARRVVEPTREDIIVVADDDVRYERLVETMDLAVGHGFAQVSFRDHANL